MRTRISVLLLGVAIAVSSMSACGNDSTAPEDTGPPTFSRMIGGKAVDDTNGNGVVVTSDGLRVVVGTCNSELNVTGSSKTLDATGTSHVYFLGFKPDGSLAWSTLVPGSGLAPSFSSMARDANNNLLVIGTFFGDVTFGTTSLTNAGGLDILIAKLDATGHPTWVQAAQTGLDDSGRGIVAAADGSIYLTGSCSGEISVGGITTGAFGKYGGFMVKLNPGGTAVWQKTAIPATESSCSGVAVSQDGSVVMCGAYLGASVSIDGHSLTNDGGGDGFISRFASDGTWMGNIHIGGTGSGGGTSITTIDDEPVIAGTFSGTVDFDVNTAGGALSSVNTDGFVARYSKTGELRWVTVLGGASDQLVTNVVHTGTGEILVCGTFLSVITAGSKTLIASGGVDSSFIRLSGGGQVLSASTVAGTVEETTAGIATAGGAAIIVGTTRSSDLAFPDGTHRSLFGAMDAFIYQQP